MIIFQTDLWVTSNGNTKGLKVEIKAGELAHSLDLNLAKSGSNKYGVVTNISVQVPGHSQKLKICVEGGMYQIPAKQYLEQRRMFKALLPVETYLREKRLVKIGYGYGSCDGSEIVVKGELQDKIRYIESLSEPQKALAYELKMRCKDMEDNVRSLRNRGVHVNTTEESLPCKLLKENRVYFKEGNYTLKNEKVSFEIMRPLGNYLMYLLYPMVTVEETEQIDPELTLKASFSSLEGLDLTSAFVKAKLLTVKIDNLRRKSPLVNALMRLPSRTLPQLNMWNVSSLLSHHGNIFFELFELFELFEF
ncbi:hypothetical protein GQR58_010007 [Nymphon striatum]|nr:hypothetical protein GQR58_010007 [Nymphon striatum]